MNDDLLLLAPNTINARNWLDNLESLQPLEVNAPTTLRFVKILSKRLLNPKYKQHPEVVALGFWLRKQATAPLEIPRNIISKPLGTVVHFTPSNVDTMFFYSWVCGLLLGNKNVIRVATMYSATQDILIDELNQLMAQPEFEQIAQRNGFVKFDRESHWTQTCSSIADARIIWGGDQTVTHIKSIAAKPRTRDISFADRYSAALIDSSVCDNESMLSAVADGLWRDSLPFQQQACSSPKILFWRGSDEKLEQFMHCIAERAKQQVEDSISRTNEQLVFGQFGAARTAGSYHQLDPIQWLVTSNAESLVEYHPGQYCFVVVLISELADLLVHQTSKLQTLSFAGVAPDELLALLNHASCTGIDRVIAVGQALNFDMVWDGMDLLSMLTRRITIPITPRE